MKYSNLLLVSLMSLFVFSTGHAQQGDADGSNCKGKTWPPANDLKCLNKGGSISCVSSTVVCCKDNSAGGRTCSDDPDDLPMKTLTGGTAAPRAKGILATPATPPVQPVKPVTTRPLQNMPAVQATDEKPAPRPTSTKSVKINMDTQSP